MTVVNHPNPPHNWRDAEGNVDWDAYWQGHQEQRPDVVIPTHPNCATCDGGGCGDCR